MISHVSASNKRPANAARLRRAAAGCPASSRPRPSRRRRGASKRDAGQPRSPGRPRRSARQKLSALMTSPHALVPRAHQVTRLMLSLMNRELPSDSSTLTPPGWSLLAGVMCCESVPVWPGASRQPPSGKYVALGVTATAPTRRQQRASNPSPEAVNGASSGPEGAPPSEAANRPANAVDQALATPPDGHVPDDYETSLAPRPADDVAGFRSAPESAPAAGLGHRGISIGTRRRSEEFCGYA